MRTVILLFTVVITLMMTGCNEPELAPPKVTSVKLGQQVIEICFDRNLVLGDEYVLKFLFETRTEKQFTGKTAVKGDDPKSCKSINMLSLIDPTMSISEEERTDLIEHHIVQGNIISVDVSINKIPIQLSNVKFLNL
ncbi:MAG: hypothetical protein BWK79_13820 [Beggiatoa sp. IS2]|nr:MAG: hypothetical protein BWK79_13820 [Beggiatoa sp. IS2]